MMKCLAATGCALLFGASLAYGGEYFIYKDPAGPIVLSNLAPPPAAEIINRYELEEVTEEEVRAAQEREQRFWQGLQAERLAEAKERLAESNFQLTQALIATAALRATQPGVLVQVAQAVTVPRRIPRR
jgi:hypothetical protein